MKTFNYKKTSGNLLNYDNNSKTKKGQKKGYKTAILYLASHKQSGFNVCPMASVGCAKSCLYSAGMGKFSNVQLGRINKTRWFMQDRKTFLNKLIQEIKKLEIRCKKEKFKPCIRLNGTSDISWENFKLFELFPKIKFYDYTKIYKRALNYVNGRYASNYHITYSLNEDNRKEAFNILKMGGNISAVFRDTLPTSYDGFKVINGDETDLRFLDPKNCIVGLKAKGEAKKDYSGFVLESYPEALVA